MANLSLFGKWIVPATVVSLAVSAIVFLGVLELSEGEGAPAVELSEAAPAAAPAAAPEAELPPAPEPRPRQQAATVAPRRAPVERAPAERRPQPGAARRETEEVAQAATLLVRLARAEDLGARLRLLDRHLAQLPAERGLTELRGLLDSVLPGKFAEAEQLRLAVLSRLGRYDHPQAEEALVSRLDVELPRPQRLLALELLAARPHVARAMISAIAAQDPDLVVQKKAAWALRHTP